jgi:prolyl-tRNA editing enzyme YbaK/EbsC (Cys-tRNA(Pro) deacylase)
MAPVTSCAEAAEAKGVDLEHELKSLLVATDHGLSLVHIRGTRRLSLRAVKRALDARQSHLASPSELHELGVAPGTVYPFAPVLWNMRQLVTREVLSMPWVTTNAGEQDRYVVFDPRLLMQAPAVLVGDYEQ